VAVSFRGSSHICLFEGGLEQLRVTLARETVLTNRDWQ
jgi:hypothetical protein